MQKHFYKFIIFLCILFFILGAIMEKATVDNPVTRDVVISAEKLIGLKFSDTKRDSMLNDLNDLRNSYQNLRKVSLPNSVTPAILFNPIPVGMKLETIQQPVKFSAYDNVIMPDNTDGLAFYSVGELGALIKSRKVTSVQLTRMYLDRIKKFAPKLECVITVTEDYAMKHAQTADDEIAAGNYKGPLHGIPFGIKDLLSTKEFKTTWGSNAYKDQMLDEDAEVVKRLESAGAVLTAKLTLGELAMGDVWYGGTTKNPWDYKHGSGGSSAGPGAAVSAGLVAFAIGSETWGSIVDPSTTCGVTGLRPTYGRISRKGAMTLAWSMDKLGPMCRTVEDCAIVFNAIYGPDGTDQTLYDVPFNYTPDIDMSNITIGYLKNDFDSSAFKQYSDETMNVLERLGVKLVPIELPKYPIGDLSIILNAECAAAFDELVRTGREDLLVRQTRDAWPNFFRTARFIPAVEYIQANRIRYLIIQEMTKIFDKVDLYLAPSLEGDNLLLTNLTGHPCVSLPNGFSDKGTPVSVSLIGNLFDEAKLLAVCKKIQDATDFHKKHPVLVE